MFTLGYQSLIQMFETVLGEEKNSCLSYLTFINIRVLQIPIMARVINYSRFGCAYLSSPTYAVRTVVINGSVPSGQPPKRMLLLLGSWLLLTSLCKSPRNRRNPTSHTSSTDVHTVVLSFLLLFEISSSTQFLQYNIVNSGPQLISTGQHKKFLLISYIMVKKKDS